MTLGDRICVMYDGVIQQVGSPMDIYERCVNRFVAGFFGTSPMNFFGGLVESKNDALCFRTGDSTITLPPRLGTTMANHNGKEMVLGIRPENLSIGQCGGESDNAIPGTVSMIEPLGARTDIYLTDKAGTKFVVSTSPRTKLCVGDAVKVCMDSEKTCIFEPGELGKNVTLS